MKESNKHVQLFLAAVVVIAIIIVATVISFKNPPVTLSPNPVLVEKVPSCQLDEAGIPNINSSEITSMEKCSFSIEAGKNDGVLVLQPGIVTVMREGKEVALLACGDQFDEKTLGAYDCLITDNPVSFQDVTNDGYADMQLKTMCGAYQCGYTYYIFNPQLNSYEKSNVLTDLVSPSFDSETKTILASAKGRGLGDTFTVTTYALQSNGTYVLIKSCSQDMIDFQDPESDYLYVCMEWNGTTMSTTSTEIIPREKVWGDE